MNFAGVRAVLRRQHSEATARAAIPDIHHMSERSKRVLMWINAGGWCAVLGWIYTMGDLWQRL